MTGERAFPSVSARLEHGESKSLFLENTKIGTVLKGSGASEGIKNIYKMMMVMTNLCFVRFCLELGRQHSTS